MEAQNEARIGREKKLDDYIDGYFDSNGHCSGSHENEYCGSDGDSNIANDLG
jgi:hypothetical protein